MMESTYIEDSVDSTRGIVRAKTAERLQWAKLITVIVVSLGLCGFFAYFIVSPRAVPLRQPARVGLYYLMALMGAALLAGILNASAKLQGTWAGVGFSFGGSAAVAFGLIFALPRLERQTRQPVVYYVRPDKRQSWTAFEVEGPPNNNGIQIFRHQRVEGRSRAFTVVFPPDVPSAQFRFSVLPRDTTVKLARDDATSGKTIIYLPSGRKSTK